MIRKPFQGVLNIIRFNWHFYLGALFLFLLGILILPNLPISLHSLGYSILGLAFIQTIVSLFVSWYVYDYSDLYQLNALTIHAPNSILNVNAGFDETSALVRGKHPNARLTVCDFYDPTLHTEISIQRARKAYPPFKGTIRIQTTCLPFTDSSFDAILAMLSAHEIRNQQEQIDFLKELHRVLTKNGRIYVTEHLRDTPNFLAYTIGFFHFHSRTTWISTFKKAGLVIEREVKSTPFITTFILKSNGTTS